MSDTTIPIGSRRRAPSALAMALAVGAIVLTLTVGVVIGRLTASRSAPTPQTPARIDTRWIDDARTSVRWQVMRAMNGPSRGEP